jgi:hypothetical protein
MELNWFHFPTSPLFLGYQSCDQHEMVSKIQIEGVGTFLMNFGARMSVLFNVKVNILVLIEWLYKTPSIMLTIEFKMVIII